MGSTSKLLVVVNDPAESRAIADGLAGGGFEVLTAPDGISGLALVGEAKPDVVVCSRTLSKLDGLEICRLIKRNHKLKHVAVLVLLDEGDDASIISSLEVGANDYIQRPLHVPELAAAVRCHVQNRTSIARLKDDNKGLATILEITEMLTSTLSSTDLFYIIVHQVAEALAVEQCTLLRIDSRSRKARIEASTNPDDADNPEADLATMPEVQRCLASGKMLYVEDVRRDAELAAAHGRSALSVLAVPLETRQEEGSRVVFRMARRGEPFTYREIKFCQIATTVAAKAIENAWLYESLGIATAALTEVSKRDPLTELYNRRYLFERLEAELSRSRRRAAPLACILIDVDLFKSINDTLGHQVGDSVLISLGRILQNSLRSHDLVGRYGGEEFLAVLVDTDEDGALNVAERIRTSVRENAFAGVGRTITISLGVAVQALGSDETVEDLIARADRALYAAKSGGRDRTVVDLLLDPVSVHGDT